MKKEQFEKRYLESKTRAALLTKQSQILAFLRFIAFLLLLAGAAVVIAGYIVPGCALAAVFVVVFLGLVVYHNRLKERLLYEESLGEAILAYIARFGDEWQLFPGDGKDFLRDSDTVLADLDILGPHSLFQFLSVARTLKGSERLADLLRGELPQTDMVQKRQGAVAELAENLDFSLHIQALTGLFSLRQEGSSWYDLEEFFQDVGKSDTVVSKLISWSALLLPPLTLLALVMAVAGKLGAIFPVILIALQWSFAGIGFRRNLRILGPLYSLLRFLQTYGEIFRTLETAVFKNEYLRQLQRSLTTGSGASRSIRKLAAIGEAANLHFNPFLYVFVSGLLMWDYQCLIAFSRWQKQYKTGLSQWIEAVGELEALMSLAVLGQVKETVSFPELSGVKRPFLRAKGILHPLIAEETAVGNDCHWQAGTVVLTGSNMSGKTTFLRSLGVNLILAYAGGPVLATEFAAAPMRIFTSMRVGDDVTRGISTFYGELLRIKEMVAYSKEEAPMLALIDEIFKGTNSADRIVGATEAIRRLAKPWALVIVSTHDFELCDLEKDPAVKAKNYHFSEYYEGDAIRFDYLLRPGRCRTTNAKHLLRLAGIL